MNLIKFLDSATQDTVSDQELMELWTSMNDEIYLPDGSDRRAMPKDARDRL